jgi:hypothetical protein
MRRGKKQNYNKNFVAHREWMEAKKLGRRKQVWVWDREPIAVDLIVMPGIGHWEKAQ